ncbi:MAG: GDYXXLXY domain-containing protein, partial [Myxococcota bacterium]
IILDGVGSGHRIAGGIVVVIGLIAIGGYYNTRRPRLSMLIALATCSTVLATTLLGRLLVVDSLFQLIFLGVLVCAIVGAWGHWLRRWRSRVLSNRGSDAAPRSMSRPEHDPIATLVERLHPVSTRTDEVAARFARADDADHDEVPIGVRLYSAVGMWVGGMLVALVLVLLGLLDNAALALLAGGTCLAAAIGLARNPPLGLVRSQLVWIVGVGAHLALASAALESGLDEVELLASATLLNATAASTIRLPSFRFGSVVATVWFAASAAHAMQLPFGVVGATLPAMALGVWVWLDEALWARRLRYAWPPLAFGLPFGAAAPILFVSLPQNRTTMASPTTLATTLFSLVLVAWVMWRTYRKDPPLQIGRGAIVAGVATLGFLLSAYTVPGLTMALVWLILAELRGSTALRGIAIIQLGLCLFLFYYNLDLSFLAKSVAVSGPGALLLLAARHGGPLRSLARSQPRWRPAIALVVVTVGLVGGSVAAKEHTLARGRTVLLPLAPVDPRSLMQGDYMDLRYDLPRLESPHSRRGLLVLTVDDDQVGRFTRFDNGDTLAGNEIRMRYRRLDAGELRLGAESFFFEEGTGHIYESARYGEVVLDEKGHSVLVGLRGRDRAPLGHSLHRTR